MKKKLLVHIGYPKTATTTLQENVFKKLFKLGEINYLGRNGIKTNEFTGDDYAIKLRKSGLYNTVIPSTNKFSTKNLNVLSDENFLMLKFINEVQYKSASDWKHMFNVISNLLEDFEVELLVTIRKQSDLIFSLFVQKYMFLYAEQPNITYRQFLNCKDSSNLKTDFELFDLEELDNFFSNYKLKVNYLFFEDLKYDKSTFSANLASILGVEQNKVFGYLDTFYRKKKTEYQNKKMHIVSVKKSRLAFLENRIKFNYTPNNVFQKIVNRVCFNSIDFSIPEPSDHLNNLVNDNYLSSNKRFFQKHSDLKARATKYKYY